MSIRSVNSGSLLVATGTIHCLFGVLVPELRDPLLRMVQSGSVVPTVVDDMTERYARECTFWFQIGGMFMITQGLLIRSYMIDAQKDEAPTWFGWTLLVLSAGSCFVMPESGWWIAVATSAHILYCNSKNVSKKLF